MKILIVSHIGVGPPHQGNRERMKQLIFMLKLLKCDITFVGINLNSVESKETQRSVDRFNNISDIGVLKGLARNLYNSNRYVLIKKILLIVRGIFHGNKDGRQNLSYSIEICRRIENYCRDKTFTHTIIPYAFNSHLFKYISNPGMKIIDTHDALGLRFDKLKASGVIDKWIEVTPDLEARWLAQADCLIAIQEEEAIYFRKLLSFSRPVLTVGHYAQKVDCSPVIVNDPNIYIGYIGSDNPSNVASLAWFFENVWNRLSNYKFSLVIAGTVCNALDKKYFSHLYGSVRVLGEIDNVSEFYELCDIVINPMIAGSGLKIKTVEAISYGKSVIGLKDAFVGLPERLDILIKCDNPDDFVDKINQIDIKILRLESNKNLFDEFLRDYNDECLANLRLIINKKELISEVNNPSNC